MNLLGGQALCIGQGRNLNIHTEKLDRKRDLELIDLELSQLIRNELHFISREAPNTSSQIIFYYQKLYCLHRERDPDLYKGNYMTQQSISGPLAC